MDKKNVIIFFIFIGLSVFYALLSLLTFLSRGRWGRIVQKKLMVGSLLISFSILVGPASGLFAQQAVPGSSSAPTPFITPTCYTPPPTPHPTPTLPGIAGDVDNNGTVDIVDALKVAGYTTGIQVDDFDASQADVDKSGSIDIVDALCIARKYVGAIDEYPDNS